MKKLYKLIYTIYILNLSLLYADITINAPQIVPLNFNGAQNLTITGSGAINIPDTSTNNYAIRLTGNLLNGMFIHNQGTISSISSAPAFYSIPLLITTTSHGLILNDGTISSTTLTNNVMLGYATYISTNAADGTIVNNGTIISSVRDNGWSIPLHIRNNNGMVRNATTGVLTATGNKNSWQYAMVAINNHANATLINQGNIISQNTDEGAGSIGMYASTNDGDIINTGSIVIHGQFLNNEGYGISVFGNNNGIIRNTGSIVLDTLNSNVISYAVNTGGGNGFVVNTAQGYMYGDIHAVGQHLENYGNIDLYTKTTSLADYFHAYSNSVLGIQTDLDITNLPVYSSLKTKGAILEDGSGIYVDVKSIPAKQNLFIGKTLLGVIKTDNNLTVNGQINVTDNTILLRFIPRYDNRNLDLVIQKDMSIEDVVKQSRCSAGALGAAKFFDSYEFENNADINKFMTELFSSESYQEISNAVLSTTPLSTLQSAYASLEISHTLKERLRKHMRQKDKSFFDVSKNIVQKNGWIETFGIHQQQECSNNYSGYSLGVSGIMMGFDKMLTQNHQMGVAFSVLEGSLSSNAVTQNEKMNRYDMFLYGSYLPSESWIINYELDLGYQNNTVKRRLFFSEDDFDGKHADYSLNGFFEAMKYVNINQNMKVYGSGYASYSYTNVGKYFENSNNGMNVTLDSLSVQSLRTGIKAGVDYKTKENLFIGMELGIDYDVLNKPIKGNVRYLGKQDTPYGVILDYDTNWRYSMNLYVKKSIFENLYFTLNYNMFATQNDYIDYTIASSLQWKF